MVKSKVKPEPTPLTPAYKYRYVCPACTGRAFFAITPEKFNTRICKNCGATVGYSKLNWIEME
jgi:NMD protein affecting ribosome stability and mRNA decay